MSKTDHEALQRAAKLMRAAQKQGLAYQDPWGTPLNWETAAELIERLDSEYVER